jgi:hypothetical protein
MAKGGETEGAVECYAQSVSCVPLALPVHAVSGPGLCGQQSCSGKTMVEWWNDEAFFS